MNSLVKVIQTFKISLSGIVEGNESNGSFRHT